jgi:hypothetical protein
MLIVPSIHGRRPEEQDDCHEVDSVNERLLDQVIADRIFYNGRDHLMDYLVASRTLNEIKL